MANFDGTDAFFDSLEVIERLSVLRDIVEDNKRLDDDEQEEYDALLALQEEAEGYILDWQYGETFHTHDSLAEYAKEIVNESYTNNDLPSWVTDHIDWEAVTDEVKVDYNEFEFRGTTYYAR